MSQRNTLRLDTSGFTTYIRKLDALGGNVRAAVTDALERAEATIADDTVAALAAKNLPAQGKYSMGETLEAVIRDQPVQWEGQVAWVPVGFDFSKPGAGGYLITGTPKMRPDAELNRMYKGKRYMNQLQNNIGERLLDYIAEKMED